ncbi:acyl-CoA thioesterase [Pararhizobium haloflavum]|uniref:acyl-CoA thioesterase n=1 Tax=Pararhizobium haloflavum TaxID=2037914 RepID=UPI000C190DEE|nr:acyl-CoA thioesterase [Pararhizobium haloflavum]
MNDSLFEHVVPVSFGHCDPAGIVFYPNFFRWFDAGFHAFLAHRSCPQSVLAEKLGTIGPGLIDVGATFRSPVTHGDELRLSVQVEAWRTRSFRVAYRGMVGQRLALEGFEVRGLFMREDDRLVAAPVAPLRAMVEGGANG